jgi:formylglycine-generating enzyme required for sulfatase activity
MKQLLAIFTMIVLAVSQLHAQTKPTMIAIAGGSFTMGSNSGESDEKPTHTVTVSSFSMGKYEITVAEYKAFCTAAGRTMPDAPSWGWNDKHPIVNVNFNDANAYCNWLSETTGQNYRLPTEAEWEYAARGGQKSNGYTYSGGNDLEEVGWSSDNAGGQTQAVGRKSPNELGLYDMSGNVWEWCKDWYGTYAADAQTNPRGPSSGIDRVLRGGSWYYAAAYCRVAFRTYYSPEYRNYRYGFRVVLPQ